jgi:hypothetical protein
MIGKDEVKLIMGVPVPKLKSMEPPQLFELASRIAWRKVPAPESAVLVTVHAAQSSAREARNTLRRRQMAPRKTQDRREDIKNLRDEE